MSERRIEELRRALAKYGRHLPGCSLLKSIESDNTPRKACDCDWVKTRDKLGARQ